MFDLQSIEKELIMLDFVAFGKGEFIYLEVHVLNFMFGIRHGIKSVC